MKRLILLFFCPFILLGQQKEHKINWESNFIFESNGLNKSFLNMIIYGGDVTENEKYTWIESGSGNNIIHSEISNELNYTYYLDHHSLGFNFKDVNILNSSFPDDFLRIALEGNFHHQDETLNFSNTNIRVDRFQQYRITYGNTINNLKINTGISYLAGNYHISYVVDRGSLYTAPYGSYLDLEYDMNGFITDTSNFSAFRNNGNGVAFDISTDLKIKEYSIHLSLENLGFILWKESSISLDTDSSFNIQGIEIENIFDLNDSLLNSNNIEDNIIRTTNSNFKSYIPATVKMSLSRDAGNKYLTKYSTGFIAKWQPYRDNTPLSFNKIYQGFNESNFSPLYYILSIFDLKYLDATAKLSYGGYTENMNIGLILSRGRSNKFAFGTNNLLDIFRGEEAKTATFLFNLQIQF